MQTPREKARWGHNEEAVTWKPGRKSSNQNSAWLVPRSWISRTCGLSHPVWVSCCGSLNGLIIPTLSLGTILNYEITNRKHKGGTKQMKGSPVSSPLFGSSGNHILLPTIVLSPYTLVTPCSWHYWFRCGWLLGFRVTSWVRHRESLTQSYLCSHKVQLPQLEGLLGSSLHILSSKLKKISLILFFLLFFGRFNFYFYQGLICI